MKIRANFRKYRGKAIMKGGRWAGSYPGRSISCEVTGYEFPVKVFLADEEGKVIKAGYDSLSHDMVLIENGEGEKVEFSNRMSWKITHGVRYLVVTPISDPSEILQVVNVPKRFQ